MADPTDPTSSGVSIPADIAAQGEAAAQAYQDVAEAQKNLTDAQRAGTGVMDLVKNGFIAIQQTADDAGVSLNNLSSLTDQQIEKFAFGAAAALKAREAFANFANVDYRGVATFGDQLKVIEDALGAGGTAAAQASKAVNDLSDKFLSQGVKMDVLARAKKAGVDASKALLGAVEAEGRSMLTHADNMSRARTAYVQMAARVGELDSVVKAAGPGMKDLDTIIERQKVAIEDSAEATGLTVAQTEQWYNQLGLIPGALKSVVDISEKGGRTQSMLSAAIQVATGTGRAQEDVMRDLSTAFKDYGIVGEKALLFSVRMSDVSSRLKAPIEDVTSALRGSADAFKMFATGQEAASEASEGLAKTLNTYGKALESTGLSASSSIEVVSQMTNQVSRLSIAQQAFVSQQTGGPGGLMGGYKIEQRLQSGDTAGVVRDVMKTLERQMGRLVSVDEAARSEAAASTLTKQTAMLQSLLGPMVKDRQQGEKLIQAMINQQKGVPDALEEALKPTGVQDAAKQGVDLQKQSNSILTTISHTLDRIRDLGDIGAGRVMSGMTAAAGARLPVGTARGAMAADLADRQRAAAERSGTRGAAFANEMATGNIRNTAGMDMATSLHTTLGSLKDIPVAVRAMGESFAGALSSGDRDSASKQEQMLDQFKQDRMNQAKMLEGNPQAQAQAMAEANAAQRVMDATKAAAGQAGATAPGSQVGTAARTAATRPPAEPGTGPGATTTPQGPGGATAPQAQNINITGHFTIDCPTCGRPNDVSPQAKVNPQQYGR